jgi:serine phosphatase RsbU (regulator of sigma subunit)
MRRQTSRSFVYRILAMRGLILLLVLVLFAAFLWRLYLKARSEALRHATQRQELLAGQTYRGIEAYYEGIIKDLSWIQVNREPATTQPAAADALSQVVMQYLEAGRTPLAAKLIAQQLGDRVSALFEYGFGSARPNGIGVVIPILPEGSKLRSADLPRDTRTWLRNLRDTGVSPVINLGGQSVSLVATPIGAAGRRLLVAAIPGRKIEANFLPLTDRTGVAAALLDGKGALITASSSEIQGINPPHFRDPAIGDMWAEYSRDHHILTKHFESPVEIAGLPAQPRMVTFAPIKVAGETWALLIVSPLTDIDASLAPMIREALVWAAIVVPTIMLIIIWTAVQLVRQAAKVQRLENEMITRELTQAREVQLQWLPQCDTSPTPGLELAAINDPAGHISGDFYNWFELSDGRQAVLIGDVTGHGMAAAFLMATTQLLVRNALLRLGDPGEAMEEVNRLLTLQVFHGQFVTMLILVLDMEQGKMDVACAGHPIPLVVHDGTVRPMDIEPQLVLGVEKAVQYPTRRLVLSPASQILLYTDGVVDAASTAGERFGRQRLTTVVNGKFAGASEMASAVATAVRQFAGPERSDDLTLVAVRVGELATPALPRVTPLTLPART